LEALKNSVRVFGPWILSNCLLYALAATRHFRLVQSIALLALFVSILLFALSYRSMAGGRAAAKYGARICAWATILGGGLYLLFSYTGR
jgi:hypothetical protein